MTRLLHSLAITMFCLWPVFYSIGGIGGPEWLQVVSFLLWWGNAWMSMVLFFARFDLNEYDLPEGY